MDLLLKRVDQLEQTNQALNQRIQQLESKPSAGGESPTPRRPVAVGTEGAPRQRGERDRRELTSRESGGVDAQGTAGRTFVREFDAKPVKRPAKVSFAEGLEFGSDDDEFKLTFHNLTQADYRGFPSQDRGRLQNQFFIPRERWYFTGQTTRAVEFYTVFNRGYGSLDLLDAFITLNPLESLTYRGGSPGGSDGGNPFGAQGTGGRAADRGRGSDSRFRFRIGRMKTPYLYEYFSIAEGDLISPERSLYAGNLAGNRQLGAMFLGELLDNRFSYAAGIFNGPRRSFYDSNSAKDLYLYLNTRPFLKSESLPFPQLPEHRRRDQRRPRAERSPAGHLHDRQRSDRRVEQRFG